MYVHVIRSAAKLGCSVCLNSDRHDFTGEFKDSQKQKKDAFVCKIELRVLYM
jgi:hypothetical protein